MPDPLGKAVTTTTTMDDNLNHCLATGKSLTGCLHFVNKTPVDWYSKKQAAVETATNCSEFVATKTATEQTMDIRQTLRYLGPPIATKSFLFGENRSVVTSATLPHSTLTKRHHICAFHRVREAIAAKLMAKAILDKHKKVTNPPKGYHRIKVHLVFAVKFDGRH